ncbi:MULTISPECIES: hypothetical protein [Streptomyces]|uniref:Secreted protein n=1 Tax=Streptomyces griseus TaxID=1911 RepID=A0A380MPC1_STRGR|nr:MULTISPECIES: hypothetical protein [Streptomyces]MDQ0293547.1 hypothetical protein [Streptomyces sp. DSM 41037]WSU35969.1 hypothetical protein OG378_09255 [Streptomyces gougerotii]GFH63741.1 hypothetical protein Srut_02550 [Streptomyces rutgersensis]SUO94470.1 Secreted protein [Streptomyces griseus]
MTTSRAVLRGPALALSAALLALSGVAHADAPGDNTTVPPPQSKPGGSTDGKGKVSAGVSQIQISQVKGGGSGKRGNLAPIDTDWEPPACWYEPVFTPEELKEFVDRSDGQGDVGIHQSWYGKGLWTDHYRDGKAQDNMDDDRTEAEGYENYNIGKGGNFWRSVAPDDSHPDSWDCGRIMFWMPDNQVPRIPNAPTPRMLAEYAYEHVKVPDTEVEVRPQAKSTVNLPTWVWLDEGKFEDVVVRAELPRTNLYAETTAHPVSLTLEPGTEDAETFPAGGTCRINKDGSIGSPYRKGSADQDPPCGITYLRASDKPYELSASITWEISWEGTGGAGGDLPDGTFETTQDMTVQEIQSINR